MEQSDQYNLHEHYVDEQQNKMHEGNDKSITMQTESQFFNSNFQQSLQEQNQDEFHLLQLKRHKMFSEFESNIQQKNQRENSSVVYTPSSSESRSKYTSSKRKIQNQQNQFLDFNNIQVQQIDINSQNQQQNRFYTRVNQDRAGQRKTIIVANNLQAKEQPKIIQIRQIQQQQLTKNICYKSPTKVIMNNQPQIFAQTPDTIFQNKVNINNCNNQIKPLMQQHSNSNKQQLLSFNFFSKIKRIKKFIQNLKDTLAQHNFSQLTEQHINLIGDKAYFLESNINQQQSSFQFLQPLIQKTQVFIKFLQKYIPVFDPDNIFILVFKIIILLLVLQQIFYITLKTCYEFNLQQDQFGFLALLRYLPQAIFSIEIFIKFNTGYYEQGIYIINKRDEIFFNYLQKDFIIDLLAALILFIQDQFQHNVFIMIAVLCLRIPQVFTLCSMINDNFQLQHRFPVITKLMKLIFLVFLVAHICGCNFHYIAIERDDIKSTWLHKQNLDDKDWPERYVNSLYFAFITMITIGFGDITPVNMEEKIYIIFMSFIASGIFAFAVNTIGSIFNEMEQREASHKQLKYKLSNYLTARNVSKSLQLKAIKYIEFVHQNQSRCSDTGEEILSHLNSALKEKVLLEVFATVLNKNSLLVNNFSQNIIQKLSLHMKDKVLSPGEVLYQRGEEDYRLYYIQKGQIEFILDKQINGQDLILDKIKCQQFLEQDSFFGQKPREFTARSLKTTQLVYCELSDFIKILLNNPKDYELYCQLKDDIKFGIYQQIELQCFACRRTNHDINHCPLLHYQKFKLNVIDKYNFSNDHVERLKIQRSTFKINCLFNFSKINEHVRNCRIQEVQQLLNNHKFNYDLKQISDKQFLLITPEIGYNSKEVILIEEEKEMEDFEDDDSYLSITHNTQGLIQNQELEEENNSLNTHSQCSQKIIEDQKTNIIHSSTIIQESPVNTPKATNALRKNIRHPTNDSKVSNQLNNKRKKSYIQTEQYQDNANQMLVQQQLIQKQITTSSNKSRSLKSPLNHSKDNVSAYIEYDQNSLFIYNFDKMKNFQFYQRKNNCQNILKNFKKFQIKTKLQNKAYGSPHFTLSMENNLINMAYSDQIKKQNKKSNFINF